MTYVTVINEKTNQEPLERGPLGPLLLLCWCSSGCLFCSETEQRATKAQKCSVEVPDLSPRQGRAVKPLLVGANLPQQHPQHTPGMTDPLSSGRDFMSSLMPDIAGRSGGCFADSFPSSRPDLMWVWICADQGEHTTGKFWQETRPVPS